MRPSTSEPVACLCSRSLLLLFLRFLSIPVRAATARPDVASTNAFKHLSPHLRARGSLPSLTRSRPLVRSARTAMHPDAAEAGAAFVGKRTPRFVGIESQEPWRSRL